MKLYFLSSRGEKRLVKENIEPETAISEMTEYVYSLNPKYKIIYLFSCNSFRIIL